MIWLDEVFSYDSLLKTYRDSQMAARIGNFIIFLILSVVTLGIYPLYFFVTRQQENTELLKEIRDEIKKQNSAWNDYFYFYFWRYS